jgi:CRP/FNR family cyclic AMP-dependent transcriptional regulator
MLTPTTAVTTLRSVPLFSQLRDSDLEQLGSLMKRREYARKRVILFANDPCEAFYIVLSGQVKLMLLAEDGREVVLSLMRDGDFFGEMALMDDEPYSASAIAVEDSSLLMLHRDDFRRCVSEMPGVSFGLLRALCGRLREADHRIGGLVLLDVTGRVSNLLLELAASNDGVHIPNPPTHQMMAQMVGSSRETVSRTIGALTAQNLIEATGRGIRILNRESLAASAGQLLKRRLKSPASAGQERRSGPYARIEVSVVSG